MTYTEFKNKYLGKQVEYHSYGAGAYHQCVDLVNQYIKDVLGLTPIIGTNAKDFKDRFKKDEFKWVSNTPNGVPNKGDIIVWNGRVGGGAGHIAIVESADVNRFKSLDQNWSKPQRVTMETHNYTNVSGWLQPIKKEVEPEPVVGWTDPTKKPPKYFLEIDEFKEAKKRKLLTSESAYDSTLSVLLTENELYNEAVREIEASKKYFDTEVAAIHEKYKTKLAEQDKAFNTRLVEKEERIQELEEKLSNSPTNMDKKALIEAGKELGRLALFGLLAYAIAYVTEMPQTETTAIILFALRFADKFLHTLGKEKGNENLAKGLTRF